MRAQPELAAEVLLALVIEDQPELEYGPRGPKWTSASNYPRTRIRLPSGRARSSPSSS
jgi:hypothetical protein